MAKLNIKKLGLALMNRGGGALLGGAAGKAVNKIIPSSIDPKIVAIGKVVIGAILPELAPKVKVLDYVGAGMTGQAGGELLAAFVPALAETTAPATSGIGADEEFPMDEDNMSGTDETVSGTEENTSPVSGMEEDDDVDQE